MKNVSLIIFLLCSLCLQARPKGKEFTLRIRYTLKCDSTCNRILFKTVIPQSIPGRQHIKGIIFSVEPDSIYMSGNNKFALFDLERPTPGEQISIQIKGKIYAQDYNTRCKQPPSDQEDVSGWLKAENCIDSDSPEIKAKADSLKGGTQENTIENIFHYTQKNFTYVPNDYDIGALGMLRKKRGDCTEFTDLFVALCRAAGIPARHTYGINVSSDGHGAQHSWAAIYMRDHGWVSFDPTPGNDATFSTLGRPYVLFSLVRNCRELKNRWFFFYYRYWGQHTPQIHADYLILR